ncbi:MAG: ABC transporter ATP-binding protein [Planctomycetota bacterium]
MTPSHTPALEIQGLTKRFGKRTAVHPLELTIRPGEMVGVLGHNGAGKSTTLGCVLGQVFPDAGTIRVAGHDVATHRRKALANVGAIFETPCFYGYLSGMQNLRAIASMTGRVDAAAIDRVVERVGMTDRVHDRVAVYSHGMRQRLALAQAMLPEPKLLILDEPSDGLDPAGIVEVRQLIRELHADAGLTVVVASHQLAEVEQLCDRVVVMDHGHKVFDGQWRDAPTFQGVVELEVDRPTQALEHAKTQALVTDPAPQHQTAIPPNHQTPARWQLAPTATPADLNAALVAAGFAVQRIGLLKPQLEDLYLSLRASAKKNTAATDEPTPEAAA